MGCRTRRKNEVRKTVHCIKRCLNDKKFSDVVKWIDCEIFYVLFKHKKSPQWSSKYLIFFKEMDHIFRLKYEKYIKEPDYDQACKRRCKANLKKLCKDDVLECLGKTKIDKCTKKVYYKFTEKKSKEDKKQTSKEQRKFPMERDWINASSILDNNYNENEEILNITLENHNMEDMALVQSFNDFAENNKFNDGFEKKNVDNSYSISQTNFHDINMKNDVYCMNEYAYLFSTAQEENIDVKYSLSDYLPILEESQDIGDLIKMVEEDKTKETTEFPFWSVGNIPNIKCGMDLNEVANTL